jgi:hypothetical protein
MRILIVEDDVPLSSLIFHSNEPSDEESALARLIGSLDTVVFTRQTA